VGPSILATSAIFALGHVTTEFHPNRLGVFFPSLVFGWLRARTGGIGACVFFHAFCNLFADYVAKSYGFGG
ncbi:MAG TPA: JDVT-CTERM system glutamic-type intramembrane protease, partial [Polyangiaceae bacterium]